MEVDTSASMLPEKGPAQSINSFAGMQNKCKELMECLVQCQDSVDVDTVRSTLKEFLQLGSSSSEFLSLVSVSDVTKSWVHLEPAIQVAVVNIKSIFRHCKDSSKIYSSLFGTISGDLAALFKVYYQLLKDVLRVLELVPWPGDILVIVIQELADMAEMLLDMDLIPVVTIWKSIKGLAISNRHIVGLNKDCVSALFKVCCSAQKVMDECMNVLVKEDEASVRKLLKVLRFLMSAVLQFIKEFRDMIGVHACECIFRLLVHIQRYLVPSFAKVSKQSNHYQLCEEICGSVFCAIQPMSAEYIGIATSATVSLRGIAASEGGCSESMSLAQLLLHLNFLELLSSSSDSTLSRWLGCDAGFADSSGSSSILDAVFGLLVNCGAPVFSCSRVEMQIRQAGPKSELSVYECALSRLCGFCARIPKDMFAAMEGVLLKRLCSPNVLCRLLAADVWCFVDRLGSDELRWCHVVFLTKLYISLLMPPADRVVASGVGSLLKRLYLLLSENQQIQFVTLYPPSKENLCIWSLYPVCTLHARLKQQILSELFQVAFRQIAIESEDGAREEDVIAAIRSVRSVVNDASNGFGNAGSHQRDLLICHVVEFWLCFHDLDEEIEMSEELICEMLLLTSSIFRCFSSSQILQIMSVLKGLLLGSDSLTLKLITCSLLKRLRSFKFPDDIQRDCLGFLAVMFRHLLSQDSWMISSQAMSSLRKFAEVTVYSQSVGQFLPASQRKSFTNFLKKVPCSSDGSPAPENLADDVYGFLFGVDPSTVTPSLKTASMESKKTPKDASCQEAKDFDSIVGNLHWETQRLLERAKNKAPSDSVLSRIGAIAMTLQTFSSRDFAVPSQAGASQDR